MSEEKETTKPKETVGQKEIVEQKETVEVLLNNGVPINKETGKIVDLDSGPKHEYRIVGTDEEQKAVGIAIPTYHKTSTQYLKDLKEFSKNIEDVKEQIRLCNKLYKIDGTVSTALDVLIDFTTSDFTLESDDQEVPEALDFFFKNVNESSMTSGTGLKSLVKEIAFEWFVSGNVFPYSTWKKEKVEGKEYYLPKFIQLLNPLNVYIPKKFAESGDVTYLHAPFTSSNNTFKTLIDQQIDMEANLSNITKDLGPKARKLEKDRIYHLKRRARSYDLWGIPYLTKTFNVVATKMKLKALDDSTTEGSINYLTIFKIGSEDRESPYHIVPKARLNSFAGLIKYPQASTTIVWPHDISIETAGPNNEILNFENKYDEVNTELIQALGVPQVLLDGKGTATASWVAILSLVERLERVRESIKEYLDYILNRVIIKNKLDVKAEFSWFPMNLRDEKMVKTLLLNYYDRGLLPIKKTLKEGGYDPKPIIKEMKVEKESEEFEDLFTRRDVPFSSPPNEEEPDQEPTEDDEEPGRPKEKIESSDLADEKYAENIYIVYNEFRNKIKNKPSITGVALQLMQRQMEQLFESYTKTLIEEDNIFSQKVNLWNGKYLEKMVSNIKETIGSSIDKFKIEGVFSEFERRLALFMSESIKNINLAVELDEMKNQGKVGALIKINETTTCESCKSYEDNFYTLEEVFDILPIHPNQHLKLEYTDHNLVLDGKVINTVIQKHPKNFSKIL